jgi:uncharacterized membrane protein YuzA (DUF378 family)
MFSTVPSDHRYYLTIALLRAAVIYAVIGIPAAWMIWYIRLYTASIKDRAFT